MALGGLILFSFGFLGYAQADTTTTLSSNVNPSVFGQSVTFVATVTVLGGGTQTPSGTVTFYDGETSLGPSTLASSAPYQAVLNVSTLSVGQHAITAEYGGDADTNPSTSDPLYQTVNKANTTLLITSDTPDPSLTGQTYTVSGTVSAASPGSGTPTGTVMVTDGAGASCAANLASGAWSCKLSSLGPQGSKTLTAVYEGDENFNGSSDTESHTVNERLVSLVIVGPSQACVGDSVTFTAQLSDGSNPAVPGSPPFSGTVTWTLPSGTTTCTVAGSDECSVTYTPASGDVGDKTISAQYTGDPNYDDSTTINHSLNVTPRSVLIDIVCQPATVYVNQITNITVTVTDVGCGASVTPTGTLLLSLV
ncbi:MAG: Ig-like domain repeat protein, partial [Dehalococcoidia bacterium]|nr:Ig-like domain repeat protein [Dehalococcoidia bacterium]